MALWRCSKCGYSTESRCKPRKCPQCQSADFAKDEGSDN